MRSLKLIVLLAFTFLTFSFLVSNRTVSEKVYSQTGGLLSAPTGVEASDNSYSTKVGINWETIRSATNYRVFRNTQNDPGTASEVGTTAANYFFDATAVPAQNYFYWVRAENSTGNSDLSQADQGVRANGTINGPVPPLEPPGFFARL